MWEKWSKTFEPIRLVKIACMNFANLDLSKTVGVSIEGTFVGVFNKKAVGDDNMKYTFLGRLLMYKI